MGLSFLSLLYLQVSYIEEMMKTRKEQFDSAVRNSLDQVSKDVEYAETRRWLIEDISEAERKALIANNASIQQDNLIQQTQRFTVKAKDGKVYSDFELKVMTTKPSELPKAMISPYRGTKTIPETSRSLVEAIKNRYMYQRALLDEVAWQMIYRGSDKSIGDRVRFKELDDYLKSSLYNNSIDLPYHFTVIDKDGMEVYRCADYEAKGSEDAYQQALFKNDPPAKMSILKVHFPGKKDYSLIKLTGSEVPSIALSATSGYFAKSLPFAKSLGWFGQIFLSYGFLAYLAIILALLSSYFLKHTRPGLHLRSVGESASTADAAGINVTRYKYLATCVGSMIAGLGGLYYVMDYASGVWSNNAFGDRGWLAIALVIFTIWRPNVSVLASILFGGLYILYLYIPTGSQMAVKELYKMLPYVVTVVVLVISSLRNNKEKQPPASLGLSYFREER